MIYRLVGINQDKNIDPPNPVYFEDNFNWGHEYYMERMAKKLSGPCDRIELQKMTVENDQLSHVFVASRPYYY